VVALSRRNSKATGGQSPRKSPRIEQSPREQSPRINDEDSRRGTARTVADEKKLLEQREQSDEDCCRESNDECKSASQTTGGSTERVIVVAYRLQAGVVSRRARQNCCRQWKSGLQRRWNDFEIVRRGISQQFKSAVRRRGAEDCTKQQQAPSAFEGVETKSVRCWNGLSIAQCCDTKRQH